MKLVCIQKEGGNWSAEKGTSEILGHKQFIFAISSSCKSVFTHKHLAIVEQNNLNLSSVIFEVLVIYPPSSCLTSSIYVFIDKAIPGSTFAIFLHFLSLTMDFSS